jgi:hypothetical protein
MWDLFFMAFTIVWGGVTTISTGIYQDNADNECIELIEGNHETIER